MEGINRIFCGTLVKNTGICDCYFDPKLIKGGIFIPANRVLTQDELKDDNIQATLEGLVSAAKADRIFPFQNWVSLNDGSEEPVQQTFGYGSIETVREGNYNWVGLYRKGGVGLSNALRSFNGLTSKYKYLAIESQNTLIGTSRLDANGEPGMGGIPLEDLYNYPWKANDGTNLAQYRMKLVFQPQYVNELIAFKKVDKLKYLLSELTGLETVILSLLDSSTNEVTVSAITDCGADVGEDFATELDNVTAWVAVDADTGDEITITGVDIVPASGDNPAEITITGNGIGNSILSLAEPSVLGATPINMVGYESNELNIPDEEGS